MRRKLWSVLSSCRYRTEERSEAAARVAVKKEVEYLLTQVSKSFLSPAAPVAPISQYGRQLINLDIF